MNKKIKYVALAVLLAIVVLIIALIVFGGNRSEKDSVQKPVPSTYETTIEELEEDVISGIEDSIFDENSYNNTESAEEKKSPNHNGGYVKPNVNFKPAESKPKKPSAETSVSEEAPSDSDSDNNTESTEEAKSPNYNGGSVKPNENYKPVKPKPTEPKPTTTKPTIPSTETSVPEESPSEVDLMDYEKFLNMTSAEQQKYVESFSDIDAFFAWYNAAKEAYEKENPPISIGNGEINIGDIIESKD